MRALWRRRPTRPTRRQDEPDAELQTTIRLADIAPWVEENLGGRRSEHDYEGQGVQASRELCRLWELPERYAWQVQSLIVNAWKDSAEFWTRAQMVAELRDERGDDE